MVIGNDYDFVTKELQGMVLHNFVHLGTAQNVESLEQIIVKREMDNGGWGME